jgi:hypothetical protein
MIIVKLVGGLGNQLFQYAFGRSASIQTSQELKLDISGYFKKNHLNLQNDEKRIPLIQKFNINAEIALENEIRKYNPIWYKAWKKIRNKIRGYDDLYVFNEKALKVSNNTYLEGFWPSEKYFKNIEKELRDELKLKDPFSAEAKKIEEMISNNRKQGNISISLHVRRGDYVNSPIILASFGIMSTEYYQKSYEELKKRFDGKIIEIFVFSDDIKWVKENISFDSPMHFVSNPKIKDYEEMVLMSKCDHNIIANSTFSWWGAWLNPNPGKIVIAPKQWVVDPRKNTDDVIPEEWIKIEQ